MNTQNIFDKVAKHLLTQNTKCADGLSCYYMMNNLKCAIGCLIDEKHYYPDLEHLPASHIEVRQVLFKSNVIDNVILNNEIEKLLIDLQFIHDQYSPDKWKNKLIELAKKHDLEFNL